MVKVNGRAADAAGMSVARYLEEARYNPAAVAVEINGTIVPKADYGATVINDGDVVEVVSFVGGG